LKARRRKSNQPASLRLRRARVISNQLPERANLNAKENKLLLEASGGQEPILCLKTQTRIDAGRWWWPTPVWLCVMHDAVILLAVARRRYLERVTLKECAASMYCHATRELVLSPVEGLEVSRLSLSPAEALQVLRVLGCQERGQTQE
jgi:hypothetical protein